MEASRFSASQYSTRVSRHRRIRGHIIDHDGAGADQRALTDGHPAQDGYTTTDAGAALDGGWDDLPVRIGL